MATIKTVFIKFDKLLGETPAAYLLQFGKYGGAPQYWFPKKLCRDFILNKKLGGNCVIPTWLYREKFGQEPDESDAETIVERHVPEPKEPLTNSKPNPNLLK